MPRAAAGRGCYGDGPVSSGGLSENEKTSLNHVASFELTTGGGMDRALLRAVLAPEASPSVARALVQATIDGLYPKYVASAQPIELTISGWMASSSAERFRGAVGHYLRLFSDAIKVPGGTREQYTWPALVGLGADNDATNLYVRVGSLMRFINGMSRDNGGGFRAGYPADVELLAETSVDALLDLRLKQEREARVVGRVLPSNTAQAIKLIYSGFAETGVWPSARDVDISAWRTGLRLKDALGGHQNLAVMGDPRNARERAELTLVALATLEEAAEDCDLIVRFVRAMAARYAANPSSLMVTAEEIARCAQIPADSLARILPIVEVQGYPLVSTPARSSTASRDVSFTLNHDLLRCADVKNVDDLLHTLLESGWNPTYRKQEWVARDTEPTIFYSWQSDLPARANRTLIEVALEKAVKRLIRDALIVQAPRVDQATQGLPGAPAIAEAILEKISQASAFVADVSIIGKAGTRVTCNPNVLFELGYAVAKLGWEKIILVANGHYGAIEELPFDLRGRRVSRYSLEASDDGAKTERDRLAATLAGQLATILNEA